MSVLLRQPHGFEGFGVVPKELSAEYLSSTHGVDAAQLYVGVGPSACSVPNQPHDDMVGNVDVVTDNFQGVLVEGCAHVLPLAHDRVSANEWPRLWPAAQGRMMTSGSNISRRASRSVVFQTSK